MKIIVAPSKTQEMRSLDSCIQDRIQVSEEVMKQMKRQEKTTKKLVKLINKLPKETIANKMKLKNQLLDDVIYNYKYFDTTESGHSGLSYTGTVFKELQLASYDLAQYEYMNQHVMILSALYGPLPSLYLIKPYRLDMTMALFETSLYKEWEGACDYWFNKEDLIIDLSSKEFSKLIKAPKVTFEFLQRIDHEVKTIAYHSKLGRGYMLNFLIANEITKIEEIKKFNIDGYSFEASKSTPLHLVFIRDTILKTTKKD